MDKKGRHHMNIQIEQKRYKGFWHYRALIDRKLVGWMFYDPTTSPVQLSWLTIKKKYRRQGVATALMTRVIQDFEGNVTAHIRVDNFPALKFAAKFGELTDAGRGLRQFQPYGAVGN